MWGLDLIKVNIGWKIGRPSFIPIWTHKWVDGELPLPLVPTGNSTPSTDQSEFVYQLMLNNSEWNAQILNQVVGETSAKKIKAIPIPSTNQKDTFYWLHSSTGEYDTKSGYGVACSN